MKFTKSNKNLFIITAIMLFVIFNICYFLFIHDLTASRIINIIGINVALICYLACSVMTGEGQENKFLSYTKMPYALGYLSITAIISNILIILNLQGFKLSLAFQIVAFAIFIILIATNKMADNVSEADTKEVKQKYNPIKEISTKLDYCMKLVENDRKLYKQIEEAYDSVKSANLNATGTEDIDSHIMSLAERIEKDISNENFAEIPAKVDAIKKEILKRNHN